MLDQEFLQIIACPKCKGKLEYQIPTGVAAVDAGGSVEAAPDQEPKLICRTCRLQYEVKDDIPILLIDEAKPL
ncbi:MAG: Trm112 family protein [candidate division KSB1 bacterium]|nr:Trm112 family protein [candidate division KSB1 bacterium]MDZ7366745.1 Trm112 family protein [candidate division KSB1 bacterium]MDZ7404758.1 Trm112 family protein [candidate division KSB1 bacterium]